MTNNARTPTLRAAESEANHPLMVAAKDQFGPLSEQARTVWHGDALPCASCAYLNFRNRTTCVHCGQDLSRDMLEKMAHYSGPWFVFDNIRPFPGVSLERILLQIRRDVINRTTIIRGPTTYYQWRFATETPLIARFLERCWQCQAELKSEEKYCPECKAVLDGYFKPGQLSPAVVRSVDESQPTTFGHPGAELDELRKAISESKTPDRSNLLAPKQSSTLGRAPLIVFIVGILLTLAIIAMVAGRRDEQTATPTTPGVQKISEPPG